MKNKEALVEAFDGLEQKNWTHEEIVKYIEEHEDYAQEQAQKARQEEKQSLAINLLQMNLHPEQIAQATELSLEQVESLLKNHRFNQK